MENEATFVAPEGVYSLTEEQRPPALHAAVIAPPHGQAYSKLSTVTVKFPAPAQKPQAFSLLGGGKDKDREKDVKRDLKPDSNADKESLSNSSNSREDGEDHDGQTIAIVKGAAFPPPSLFSPVPVFPGKKRGASRPRHNLKTTSSTFVTRFQAAEGLSKILQSKQGEVTFFFYNTMKSFFWSEPKAKDPLARITFSAYPTCHDVNQTTATNERLDVIIGFNTGDLIWFDPILSRYVRINKQGSICNSVCTSVRWVPKSSTLFIVSYADGSIVIFDTERDDGTFTPQVPKATNVNGPATSGEWDPNEEMFVSMPPWHPASPSPNRDPSGKSDKTGKNPISHWKLSKMSIFDFVFSPDVRYVAAVSEDGCLRIIDTLSERLVDTFASYFGSLTCVAWSPDGRFILTGGQDDLITVISPWEQRVIARCQGHSSFVSSLEFDELRCDGRTYRFGSVGEDNKLIFWDFSSGALHRPKLQPTYPQTHNQRHSLSLSSTVSLVLRRRSETIDRSTSHLPHSDTNVIRYHPAPSRNDVAILQPVLIKNVEGDILSVISFLPNAVVTVTRTAHIKCWVRPLAIRLTSKRGKAVS